MYKMDVNAAALIPVVIMPEDMYSWREEMTFRDDI